MHNCRALAIPSKKTQLFTYLFAYTHLLELYFQEQLPTTRASCKDVPCASKHGGGRWRREACHQKAGSCRNPLGCEDLDLPRLSFRHQGGKGNVEMFDVLSIGRDIIETLLWISQRKGGQQWPY